MVGQTTLKLLLVLVAVALSLEDIRLFKKHIGPNVKIKAAGGIRSISDMKSYIAEGCSRIGASAAVELLKDRLDEEV